MSDKREEKWSGCLEGQVSQPDSALAASHADAERFAGLAALDTGLRARLMVVVDEIVSNIVNHGAPPPGSTISWRFAEEDGSLRLRFTDAGTHFDPRGRMSALPDGEAALAAAAASERTGGLGWRLVLAWCDVAACERRGETNHLELVLRPA